MDVGVRELKQRLSEVLDIAAGGDIVVVTDRGVPKVRITAVEPAGRYQQGVEQGWIRPAPSARRLVSGRRFPSMRSVIDVLDDDRGE